MRCALIMAFVCIGIIHVPAASTTAVPGRAEYRLVVDDDLISLAANEASLSAIIEDIEEALAVSIKVTTEPPRTVSGTFTKVSLHQLLSTFEVDYILFYEKDGLSGAVHLNRGGISRQAPPRHTPDPDGSGNRSFRPGRDAVASEADESQDASPVSEQHIRYVVVKGDTLERIAGLFIVSLETLAADTGIGIDAQLQPGQTILIPPTPFSETLVR